MTTKLLCGCTFGTDNINEMCTVHAQEKVNFEFVLDTPSDNMRRQMIKLADRMERKFLTHRAPNSERARQLVRNWHSIMNYVKRKSHTCDWCGKENVKPDMLFLGDEHNVFLVLCKSCNEN